VAGTLAGRAERFLEVENMRESERVNIELEQLTFHSHHINKVGWVGEMAGGSRHADVDQLGNCADIVRGIDDVWPYDELVALIVDEAVRISAVHACRMARHLEILVDHAQACARAGPAPVGNVVENIELPTPRHQAANPALGTGRAKISNLCEGRNDAGEGEGRCAHSEARDCTEIRDCQEAENVHSNIALSFARAF